MRLQLKERLARLGPTQAARPNQSGSPAVVVLRPNADRAKVKAISATKALIEAGLTMLKAKRAIEAALAGKDGSATELPAVDDIKALARKLRAAGFTVAVPIKQIVDVKTLRESLDLSQEQFALRFNFPIATVRNWEQGRGEPDAAANNYLHVIKSNPAAAAKAVEELV